MKPRGPKAKSKWGQSAEFRKIGRRAVLKIQRVKCGANRKYDGRPCQQPAMANGRCFVHGGLTRGGDQWHVIQWPSDPKKLFKKLAEVERRQKKQRERITKMTPDELAKYRHWLATHRPGRAAARRAGREALARADEAAALFAGTPTGQDQPELQHLSEKIARLEKRAVELAEKRAFGQEGVFE